MGKWSVFLRGLALGALLVPIGVAQSQAAEAIAVSTFQDELTTNGRCSLREAIQAVNTGLAVDTCPAGARAITLSAGRYNLALPVNEADDLRTGDLDLMADVTITGAGPTATILDGGDLDRIFEVHPGATAVLDSLAVENGTARSGATPEAQADGGGVANHGTLTLRNTRFYQNYVDNMNGIMGGGAAVLNTGTLDIIDTEFTKNIAEFYVGGGIFNTGQLTVTGGTFDDNSGADGGAINNTETGTATITLSTFIDNHAEFLGGSINNEGNLSLADTLIDKGRSMDGCGVASRGTLTLKDTVIQGCKSFERGGAVFLYGGVNSLVSSVTLKNNITSNGAGIYLESGALHLDNATVRDNVANSGGGGIFVEDGQLEAVNSTLASNQAGLGGGVYISGGTATLLNLTLAGNTTTGAGGGLMVAGGEMRLRNTLVGANLILDQAVAPDCAVTGGALVSEGHNLLGDPTSCDWPEGPGDILGTFTAALNPLLGVLELNGGTTETIALLPGSPAIDAGDPAVCPAFDQRGEPRPQDGNLDGNATCDIGAYEVEGPVPTATPTLVPTATPTLVPTPVTPEPTQAAAPRPIFLPVIGK